MLGTLDSKQVVILGRQSLYSVASNNVWLGTEYDSNNAYNINNGNVDNNNKTNSNACLPAFM